MAKDHGTAVVVHGVGIDVELPGKIDVVDDKRIVRLDDLDVGDAQSGLFQGHTAGRNRCGSHVSFAFPGKTIGDDLNRDGRIAAQFFGLLLGGNDDAGVAVSRVGLGTETLHASGNERF